MRITNSMLKRNFLTDYSANLERMQKYQRQMETGKRITKLSDDPVGAIHSMQARYKLYNLEQYEKNAYDAMSIMDQAETSVSELNEAIKDLLDNTINSDDLKNADDKQATAEVVKQIMEQIVNVGNTTLGNKYIFGGFNTLQRPFEVNDDGELEYNGIELLDEGNAAWAASEDEQAPLFEVGFGITMEMSVNGGNLFGKGENNLYSVCKELYDNLMTDAPTEDIMASIDKLQTKQSELLSITAQFGGKTQRLEMITSRYEMDFENYTEVKSRVEDVDEAEAIMNFAMAEAVYNAALNAGGRVIQPTLMDYLR